MTERGTGQRKDGRRVAGRQTDGRTAKSETEKTNIGLVKCQRRRIGRQLHWLTITTQTAAAINHWRGSTATWRTRSVRITGSTV